MDQGTFVRINYSERVLVTGRVADTNIESVAREAGIYHDEEPLRYTPTPVIVGLGKPIQGVDEEIAGMEVGESRDFEVPAAKAYGPRDSKLLKMMPVNFFRKQGITPVRGLPVRTRRGIGIVRSTSGGRVVLDYNHPLAGQTMEYHVEILDQAADLETKVRWLLQMRVPEVDPESHAIEIGESKVRIYMNIGDAPETARAVLEKLVEKDITERVDGVDEVAFGPEEVTEAEVEGEENLGGEDGHAEDEEKHRPGARDAAEQ